MEALKTMLNIILILKILGLRKEMIICIRGRYFIILPQFNNTVFSYERETTLTCCFGG